MRINKNIQGEIARSLHCLYSIVSSCEDPMVFINSIDHIVTIAIDCGISSDILSQEGKRGMKYRKKSVIVEAYQTDKEVYIETAEGTIKAEAGDYIITGSKESYIHVNQISLKKPMRR